MSDKTYRRDVLKYATGGVATFSLAGCQGNPQGGSNEASKNTPGGSVENSDKFANQPFKLGLLPIDESTPLGLGMVNSMKLAVEEINKNGGILGGDVEVLVKPTKLQPAKAKRGYRELTYQENVDATFGITFTIKSILQPMAQQKTLHFNTGGPLKFPAKLVSKKVSVTGADPAEEYKKYKYFFRYGPPNFGKLAETYAEFVHLYADQLGWESGAILIEDLSLTEGMDKQLKRQMKNDIDIPIAKRISGSTSDWTPIWDELESAGVDVAIVGFGLAGAAPVQQWARQERPFEMGGIHVRSMIPSFWNDTSGATEALFSMNAITPQATNTPRTQPFLKKYQKQFNSVPIYSGPLTYDAVRLYADAVRETGSRDPETLIPYLEKMVWKEGVLVDEFSFHGPNARFAHDPVLPCLSKKTCGEKAKGVPLFQQWQKNPNGKGGIQAVVAPEQNRTHEFIKPPWMR